MSLFQIRNLAKTSLTEGGYNLLELLLSKIPDIWDKPTSSTGKYHKRKDGTVPSVGEHTFEMFEAAVKTIRLFGNQIPSKDNDAILLGIILHDSYKYGEKGTDFHTSRGHEKIAADKFEKNSKIFLSHFSEEQLETLLLCVRFHSGIWSPDAKKEKLGVQDFNAEVLFVHFLDMLSTASYLKEH